MKMLINSVEKGNYIETEDQRLFENDIKIKTDKKLKRCFLPYQQLQVFQKHFLNDPNLTMLTGTK